MYQPKNLIQHREHGEKHAPKEILLGDRGQREASLKRDKGLREIDQSPARWASFYLCVLCGSVISAPQRYFLRGMLKAVSSAFYRINP